MAKYAKFTTSPAVFRNACESGEIEAYGSWRKNLLFTDLAHSAMVINHNRPTLETVVQTGTLEGNQIDFTDVLRFLFRRENSIHCVNDILYILDLIKTSVHQANISYLIENAIYADNLHVLKILYDYYPDQVTEREYLNKSAVYGRLDFVKYYESTGLKLDFKVLKCAWSSKNDELIDYVESRVGIPEDVCVAATRSGKLKILQRYHDSGYELFPECYTEYDNIPVQGYLIDKGNIQEIKQVEILQYLIDKKCPK